MNESLNDYLRAFRGDFEPALVRAMDGVQHRYTPRLLDAMRYTPLAGGKRIRPAVIDLFARATPAPSEPDIHAAGIAVELIHACSLVLDDLPSMDDATLRRGRPCCHIEFGLDTAILAANAQLMLAFEHLATLDQRHPTLGATATMARAVGAAGMIGGQHVDLHLATADRELQSLEYIHRHKTGVLFEACAKIGVGLGGGDDALQQRALVYARNLGLAFQIKDDLLDATGHASEMGKDARMDRGKETFVTALGDAESKEIMLRLLATARQSVHDVGPTGPRLGDLCDYVATRRN